jgi:hypothetical protein
LQIQVRTDHHVDGDEALIAFVRERVGTVLAPYAARITGVEARTQP